MPSEMRWVSWLIRMICTLTVWPMLQDFRRMVDAAPCHVGDVQQAVDAAEVDERTVIGDVLDHALDDLALFEVLARFPSAARRGSPREPCGARRRCCRGACPS